MIYSMDKEKYILIAEILIKAVGIRINIMVMVFIFIKMETNMNANFKMERNMAKEHLFGLKMKNIKMCL